MKQNAEPVTLEKMYGEYPVRICFAPQDVPGADTKILDLITQAYLQRIAPDET